MDWLRVPASKLRKIVNGIFKSVLKYSYFSSPAYTFNPEFHPDFALKSLIPNFK